MPKQRNRRKFPASDAIMAGIEERIEGLIVEAELIEAGADEVKAIIERHLAALRKMQQQARHWTFFESLDMPHLVGLMTDIDYRLIVAGLIDAGAEVRYKWRRALDEAERQGQ